MWVPFWAEWECWVQPHSLGVTHDSGKCGRSLGATCAHSITEHPDWLKRISDYWAIRCTMTPYVPSKSFMMMEAVSLSLFSSESSICSRAPQSVASSCRYWAELHYRTVQLFAMVGGRTGGSLSCFAAEPGLLGDSPGEVHLELGAGRNTQL